MCCQCSVLHSVSLPLVTLLILRWNVSVHNQVVMCTPQNGKTPMDIAVEKGHKDIIEVLKNAQRKVRCTCTVIRPTFTVL